MKIKFIAHSERAKLLFKKYVDVPAKEIRSISIVKEEPLIVEVEPRIKGLHAVAVKRAIRKPHLRAPIEDAMKQNYVSAMLSEGVKPEEYSISVVW